VYEQGRGALYLSKKKEFTPEMLAFFKSFAGLSASSSYLDSFLISKEDLPHSRQLTHKSPQHLSFFSKLNSSLLQLEKLLETSNLFTSRHLPQTLNKSLTCLSYATAHLEHILGRRSENEPVQDEPEFNVKSCLGGATDPTTIFHQNLKADDCFSRNCESNVSNDLAACSACSFEASGSSIDTTANLFQEQERINSSRFWTSLVVQNHHLDSNVVPPSRTLAAGPETSSAQHIVAGSTHDRVFFAIAASASSFDTSDLSDSSWPP
jgi:hypothetical protein